MFGYYIYQFPLKLSNHIIHLCYLD